jgi:hypothetical protein
MKIRNLLTLYIASKMLASICFLAKDVMQAGILVEHLPPGYYTVKITLDNNLFTTSKLIKS